MGGGGILGDTNKCSVTLKRRKTDGEETSDLKTFGCYIYSTSSSSESRIGKIKK